MVGLDVSAAMLAAAAGGLRSRPRLGAAAAVRRRRASTPRSRSRSSSTSTARDRRRLRRGPARAPAGRDLSCSWTRTCCPERPAALAAEPGGQVDRRAAGALDVPGRRPGPRALVLAARLRRGWRDGSPRCGSRTSSRPTRRAGSRSDVARARGCSCSGRPGRREAPRDRLLPPIPASLPLLLWETPPGLELILAQEGVPFEVGPRAASAVFRGGRFVLYDGREDRAGVARGHAAQPEHVAIDIDTLRRGEPVRPVRGPGRYPRPRGPRGGRLPDADRAGRAARQGPDPPPADRPAAPGRHRGRRASGSAWRRSRSRIARRSTSGPTSTSRCADDYVRFAAARTPLADCCTHFVSTHAYGQHPRSCGTCGATTPSRTATSTTSTATREANRLNLERAHRILGELGIRARRASPRRTAAGTPASTTRWRTSATCTRPTSSSATTTSRSSPGRATGSRGCSRSRCIRSARACSSTPASPTAR